jgi:hypothetical protein
MRRQISRRLEALERAAETEVFANALTYAVAYYLGGAKHFSDALQAYGRALGYENFDEACRGFAELFIQSSDRFRPLGHLDRVRRAQCKLFAKFGFDLRGADLAALDDAVTKIVRTLPKDWRAAIISADRESREAQAEVDQFLQQLMIKLEESNACLPDQTAPRRPKKAPRAVRTKVVGRTMP